ncbi:MAG: Hpt domain-containing protein [Acidobacteriota bacterium]
MSPALPLSLVATEAESARRAPRRSAPRQTQRIPDPTETPCLDASVLDGLRALERRLDKSVLPGMLEVFEAHVPASCADMRRALEEGDAVALRKISHKLKSSAHCLGLARLSAVSAELEQTASTESLAGAEEQLATIEEEYDRAAATLRRFLKG